MRAGFDGGGSTELASAYRALTGMNKCHVCVGPRSLQYDWREMIDRLSENDIIGENRARHQDKRINGHLCQLDPSVCLSLISTQPAVR